MVPTIVVLVGVGVTVASVTGILTIMIIGIRRGDRHHLANAPQSSSDAFARRLLVGLRYPSDPEGEDQ